MAETAHYTVARLCVGWTGAEDWRDYLWAGNVCTLQDKFEERIKKMGRIRETLDSDRSPEEEKIYSGARQRFKVCQNSAPTLWHG